MARDIILNRQLLGLEDLLFGEGTELQSRGGQEVIISKIISVTYLLMKLKHY